MKRKKVVSIERPILPGKIRRKIARIDHPIVQRKINESLDISVKEGCFASIPIGIGLNYLSPFALAMKATSSQIGILFAIINLLPSLVQLRVASWISKFSRKRILLKVVLINFFIWIPIILTAYFYYLGYPYMVWVLIFLVALLYTASAISHPVWFSWMGSLVPEKERGKYFSRRSRVVAVFSILTMIAGATILDYSKKLGAVHGNILGYTLFGFGILFSIAAVARFWTLTLLRKQYEPKLIVRKKDYFSFWDFMSKGRNTPFGRFVIYRGFFSFIIGIAGPFWVVYILRNLGFSYVWYMLILISEILFQMLFLPLLGKISDRFGNVRLIKLSTLVIVFTPVFYIITSFMNWDLGILLFLIFLPGIFSGIAIAGYNLAVNNYLYDAVRAEKRELGISYMNLFVGFGTFLGAMFGTFLVWLDFSFMDPILFVFMVSVIGRLFMVIFGTKNLREVRNVRKFSSNYLIREFQPVQGFIREIHNLENVASKVQHYI